MEFYVVALVFDGIVHEVEDHVGEVHFVHIDFGMFRTEVRGYGSAVL